MKHIIELSTTADGHWPPPQTFLFWISLEDGEGSEVVLEGKGSDVANAPEDATLGRDFNYVFKIARTIFEEVDGYDGEVEFHSVSERGLDSYEEAEELANNTDKLKEKIE